MTLLHGSVVIQSSQVRSTDDSALSGCMVASRLSCRLHGLTGLFREADRGRLFPVLRHLALEVVCLPQLLLDGAQLLTKKELALVAVDLAADLGRQLLLHLGQRDLALEELVDPAQPRHGLDRFQHLLRIPDLETEVRRREIGEAERIFKGRGDQQHFG